MTKTTPSLSGSHLRTYQTIFQHPVSHNLPWRDVYALLAKLGEISEEPNGNRKVMRNGQAIVLQPQRTKDVADADQLIALRRFLEQSETASPSPEEKTELHWLLVIDHHEARIFRSKVHGAVPEQILPHEPSDFFRHEQDSKATARGKEKPDPNSFFGPVANALKGAGKILIFGAGTGMSSEMDQFSEWLSARHPELAARVIGTLTVDEHHLTPDQLLAKARDFYEKAQANPVQTI